MTWLLLSEAHKATANSISQRFREDLKEIVLEKSTRFDQWNPDKKQVQFDAQCAANRAKNTKWDLIAGILGITTPFLPNLPWIVSIVGGVLTLLTLIRRAAVKVLLYEYPYELWHPDNVKFACAWNRAMEGWMSLLVVPLGIISILVPGGYRLGLWIIADHAD